MTLSFSSYFPSLVFCLCLTCVHVSLSLQLNLLLLLFLFGYFMNQEDMYISFGFQDSTPILIGLILFLQLVLGPYNEVSQTASKGMAVAELHTQMLQLLYCTCNFNSRLIFFYWRVSEALRHSRVYNLK